MADARRFLRDHGAACAAGLVLVLGIGVAVLVLTHGDNQPVRKVPEVMMVKLQPLPPPPPPPPPPKMIEQPKMVEQTPVKMPEPKPDKPMDKPKAEPPKAADAPPPGPLALDAKGEGPADAFNLGGNPGGNGLLGGDGGGGGSRWGWYAAIVQTRIEAALRANGKTRNASARNEIRLWLDAGGRVERARLVSSTGDAEVDRAIETEVLPGLGFDQAPPRDMPMPVVVRLTAHRPS
jgi:periplasmic protein TonB